MKSIYILLHFLKRNFMGGREVTGMRASKMEVDCGVHPLCHTEAWGDAIEHLLGLFN